MTINHHPDKSTIMSYAAGTLDEAFAVIVSCHLEVCAHCRDALKTAELIGGNALDSCDEAQLDNGSFGRLLEKINVDNSAKIQQELSVSKASSAGLTTDWESGPAALMNYLDMPVTDVKWKRAGPGVWQRPIELSKGANSSLRLLRIGPDRKVPEHGHGGQELTLILSGCYQDEIGSFSAGDIADLDEDIEHQPHVVSDEDCICLAATESATRFKGIAGRLFQPFVGI